MVGVLIVKEQLGKEEDTLIKLFSKKAIGLWNLIGLDICGRTQVSYMLV